MELRSRRTIGGGVLLSAGALLCRETIFWAIGRVLDAGARYLSAAGAGIPPSAGVPWLDLLGLMLMVIGIGLLASAPRTKELAQSDWEEIKTSLFIASIDCDLESLTNHHLVEFNIGIFNGNSHKLVFDDIAGNVLLGFDFQGNETKSVGPTPPSIRGKTAIAYSHKATTICIQQPVKKDIEEAILLAIKSSKPFSFFFQKFRVSVSAEDAHESKSTIEIWDGIRLDQNAKNHVSSRLNLWGAMAKAY